MASEQVLEVLMRRHVFHSERPFAAVLDGIFGGITQPDTPRHRTGTGAAWSA